MAEKLSSNKGFSHSLEDAAFYLGCAVFPIGLFVVFDHPFWGGLMIAAGGLAAIGAMWKSHVAPNGRLVTLSAMMILCFVVVGYDIYQRQPDYRDSPVSSAQEIEKITAPFRSQIQQLQDQVAELHRQLANRSSAPLHTGAAPPQPYSLTEKQRSDITDALFQMKDRLPPSITVLAIMYDPPSMNLRQQIATAFNLAGIVPNNNWSRPTVPSNKGIWIRVANINNIPDGAKQFAQILKDRANLESHFEAQTGIDPTNFEIFVGQRP